VETDRTTRVECPVSAISVSQPLSERPRVFVAKGAPTSAISTRYNAVVNRVLTVSAALVLAASFSFGGPLRLGGTVKRGQFFRHRLNRSLIFGLDPTEGANCDGWHAWVGPSREENFSDLATGPLHGFSVLDVCATDFRNSDNSGPNVPGSLNVNRPGRVRQFRFVTTRDEQEKLYRLAENPATANDVLPHVRLNKGSLTITRLSLGHLDPGMPPTIEQMDFAAELDIPSENRR
jgi:hypothetical protein